MSVGTRIKEALKTTLYKFQVQGVRFIEQCDGRMLLGDDMGIGKTIHTIARDDIHPDIRPMIVVCPASLKYNWQREFKIHANLDSQVLDGHKCFQLVFNADGEKKVKSFTSTEKRLQFIKKSKGITVLDKPKNNPPPFTSNILILNYEILADWMPIFAKLKPKFFVMDECHYAKERSTIRTKQCKKLARRCAYVLALSGTPIINRPVEFFPILQMLRPIEFDSFWNYAFEYCNPKRGFRGRGWDYAGASNTKELHERVSKFMIRRLKTEVLTELPPKQRSVIPVQIDNRSEYDKATENFLDWLEKKEGERKADQASKAEALVKIGKLKQLAAKGKIKTIVQWIKDWLEETDQKLVVFGVHRSILQELKDKFPTAAVVDGSVSNRDRQSAVDRFQTDPKCRLFFGNLKAAGVGITLTEASTALFLELGWTPGEMEQAEDRIYRIGQLAASVNIIYFLGLNTIEERVWEMIEKKRDICSRILDGKKIPVVSLRNLVSRRKTS